MKINVTLCFDVDLEATKKKLDTKEINSNVMEMSLQCSIENLIKKHFEDDPCIDLGFIVAKIQD